MRPHLHAEKRNGDVSLQPGHQPANKSVAKFQVPVQVISVHTFTPAVPMAHISSGTPAIYASRQLPAINNDRQASRSTCRPQNPNKGLVSGKFMAPLRTTLPCWGKCCSQGNLWARSCPCSPPHLLRWVRSHQLHQRAPLLAAQARRKGGDGAQQAAAHDKYDSVWHCTVNAAGQRRTWCGNGYFPRQACNSYRLGPLKSKSSYPSRLEPFITGLVHNADTRTLRHAYAQASF